MSSAACLSRVDLGRGGRRSAHVHPIALEHVGGRYFETLSVPIVRGRTFTEHDFADGGAVDARESETPVVINQTAEQRIFGAGSAVGRQTTMAEVTSWSAWSPTSGPGCST